MWNIFNEAKIKDRLFFENVKLIKNKQIFIFSTDLKDDDVYCVVINGSVHSYRLIREPYALSYNDKYMDKNDISMVFSKTDICYTHESEYLEWFKKTSCRDWKEKELYHFYINAEDYVVEFITDEMPLVTHKSKNDFSED